MGSVNTDVMDYRENLGLHSPGDVSSDVRSLRRTPDSTGERKSEDIQSVLRVPHKDGLGKDDVELEELTVIRTGAMKVGRNVTTTSNSDIPASG